MKVLDLFSGIGGFSLGLERAGMETIAFCEQDKHCQKVLQKHWPNVPIFGDIRKLNLETFDAILPNDELWQNIDVICGGFPCQDLSVAGQKKGFTNDLGQTTRSGLWKEFKRIIKEVKPQYAIIENVANLRNLGLNKVIKDLWSIGYACEWHIISARSIGACHLRERIWIIAYPDNERLQRRGAECEPREVCKKIQVGSGANDVANPNVPRLWKAFATEKEKSEWWAKATLGFRDWWKIESPVCRVDDGVPDGLDKVRRERIKQLGNAVVPQIVELIGREIIKIEKGENDGVA